MTELNAHTKAKIEELQTLESNMQQLLGKKQQFQSQLLEVDSALCEVEGAKEVHKIIGNVMVAADKEAVKAELVQKKDMLGLRVQSVEKQEKKLQERAEAIQKEVLAEMKKQG